MLFRTLSAVVLISGLFINGAWAQARSDDDDAPIGAHGDTSALRTTAGNELAVALLPIRITTIDEKKIPPKFLEKMNVDISDVLSKINIRKNTVVVPFGKIKKRLEPKQLQILVGCWLKESCLVKVFENYTPALDYAVASKLMFEKDSVPSLTVKLIDLRKKKSVDEMVISDLNFDSLRTAGATKLHDRLVSVGLIIEKNKDAVVVGAGGFAGAAGKSPRETPTSDDESGPGPAAAAAPSREPAIEKSKIKEETRVHPYVVGKWTTFGTGLGVLGLGLGFSLQAYQNEQNASKAVLTSQVKDQNNKAQQRAMIANVSFGVGGALLVTSAVLFMLDGNRKGSGGGLTFGAAPTPDGGGTVGVGGTF